jgi:hypothetical protein
VLIKAEAPINTNDNINDNNMDSEKNNKYHHSIGRNPPIEPQLMKNL